MINKIEIEDYETEIKSEKYEEIYNDLINKSIELIEEIGKIKDYEIPKNKRGLSLFNSIQSYFQFDSIQFADAYYLMECLKEWNKQNEEVNFSYERKINSIIMRYNNLIDKIEIYKKVEKEVKEKGLENTIKDREEKYRKDFEEKLKSKNKKIDESSDIVGLVRKVNKYTLLKYDEINDVEKVLLMDNIYNYIMLRGYKKVNSIYSNEYMGYK